MVHIAISKIKITQQHLFTLKLQFPDNLEVATAVVVSVWIGKTSLHASISADIFSYSGPSGILGSDGKQTTVYASGRGLRIAARSYSSHEQTQ